MDDINMFGEASCTAAEVTHYGLQGGFWGAFLTDLTIILISLVAGLTYLGPKADKYFLREQALGLVVTASIYSWLQATAMIKATYTGGATFSFSFGSLVNEWWYCIHEE
jgi:hypothetical protein